MEFGKTAERMGIAMNKQDGIGEPIRHPGCLADDAKPPGPEKERIETGVRAVPAAMNAPCRAQLFHFTYD